MSDSLPLLSVDGTPALVEYLVDHPTDPVNTPKPHVHPLRSPGGTVVTDTGPEDHPWHHGLQFAMPYVGSDNLWGGGSYLGPDRGYVVIDNQGEIRHEAWAEVEVGDDAASAVERLSWLGHGGGLLLEETRRIDVRRLVIDGVDALVLDHRSGLTNVTDDALELATPAQKGRNDGGYGGLFLRLASSFALVDAASSEGPAEGSGQRGEWFAVHATVEGRPMTFGFADLPDSEVTRSRWLYRFEDFPAVGWAVAYDDGIDLEPGASVTFAHRLVVAEGHVPADDLAAALLS